MGVPKGGIAFFDSGIGGLTVLAECKKLLKNQIFYYYGDNLHAPYGNLPSECIKRYVFRAFKKIARLRPRAVVVACNTATAVCVEELRKKYSFPIVGAEPAVFLGARGGGETLILATRATCESARFQTLCARARERFSVFITPRPCNDLAGEIEKHILDKGWRYEHLLPLATPQTVVLGCTHYVYIAEQIQCFYGCETVDGNRGIALRLQAVLSEEKGDKNLIDHLQLQTVKKSKKNTRKTKKKFGKAANKRSCSHFSLIPLNKRDREDIYFLGTCKKRNKIIFKQTFG